MKKIVRNIGYLLLLTIGVTSCKSQLEDMYVDPDKTTTPTIEKLFAGILDNNRIRPHYYEIQTVVFRHSSRYAQTAASSNDENVFRQDDRFIQDKWNDFYVPNNFTNVTNQNNGAGTVAQYSTIVRLYNEMDGGVKRDYEVFYYAARVIMLDQAAQMVDMYGDLPFFEAGSLNRTNTTIASAKFDNQDSLYHYFEQELFKCANWFSSAYLTSTGAAAFAVQDYVNHGDLLKWSRFAASLRLRLLMRMSFAYPDYVRAQLQDMFSRDFRFIDGDGMGETYNPAVTDVLLHQPTTYTDNLWNAFNDYKSWRAPDYMLNTVMHPVNDPRIPFMFDKFGKQVNGVFVQNPDYVAAPVDMPKGSQDATEASYARFDSTTFIYNSRIPGIMMSAAETNFLLAEAVERWGLTGNNVRTAQQHYELGVRQAIAYLYYQYMLNPTKLEALTMPSTATINTFMAQPSIAYTGTTQEKLGKIWTQKWVAFNFLQSNQSWAETRRTDYPQFPKEYVASSAGFEHPPTRFRYPSSEVAYNLSYTEDVRAKDTRDTKIFWDVPQPF